jgi:hypothetical protein
MFALGLREIVRREDLLDALLGVLGHVEAVLEAVLRVADRSLELVGVASPPP